MPVNHCPARILVLFLGFRCNLRCVMCSGWIKQKETRELTLPDIDKIFQDQNLCQNLEIINLTGGEPTLRENLDQIVQLAVRGCPRLRRIDLSTNGVRSEQVLDAVERLLAVLLPTNIRLTTCVSLDGIGELHERIRGQEHIFAAIDRTIKALKELMGLYTSFDLGLNMTVGRLNYFAIDDVLAYAERLKLGLNFTLAAVSDIGVESRAVREQFELQPAERELLALKFLQLRQAHLIQSPYADFLIRWLKTGQRKGNCAFQEGEAVLIEPTGNTYCCGNFKDGRIGNILNESFATLRQNSQQARRLTKKHCLKCVSNCYR